MVDLCIPMHIFEICVYTAFKCHPNGCELRKKLSISFSEIVRDPQDINILRTSKHEKELGAFFMECMGFDYNDFNLTEISKAGATTVYIDLANEQIPHDDDDDDDEEEYQLKQVPKSKQKSTVPYKKFDSPKVNIARITNHGSNESSKRGRELYEHLKFFYDSTKYGDGSVMSICYTITHIDNELYFRGSEAHTDSEYVLYSIVWHSACSLSFLENKKHIEWSPCR